jgi:hypothetical protein
MAVFSIEIADVDVNRVMDAITANYQWQENVLNPDYDSTDPESLELLPNPEDKFKFTNRMVRQFLADHVVAYEVAAAKSAAVAATDTSITIDDPQP